MFGGRGVLATTWVVYLVGRVVVGVLLVQSPTIIGRAIGAPLFVLVALVSRRVQLLRGSWLKGGRLTWVYRLWVVTCL